MVTVCSQTLLQETIYCLFETDTLSTDEMVDDVQIDWESVSRQISAMEVRNMEIRRNTTYTQDLLNLGSSLLALGYYTIFGGSMCFLLNVVGAGLEMSGLVAPAIDA